MGFVKEFREFALKGNVMDMAVGIIIGGAFGIIVKSMIDDVIMPVIGIAGKADFTNLYFGLTEQARANIEGLKDPVTGAMPSLALVREKFSDPVLAYGNFITVVINFAILAFAIFIMIKMMNTAKRRFDKEQAAAPAPPAAPAEDVLLLTEIRDLLKAKT